MTDAGVLERRAFAKGETIIYQGEMGVSAFLIQSGEVVVFTENGGKRIELARMGPGQIVGEMALVSDTTRTASVQATTDCNLITITREVLQEKLNKSDPTVRALVQMLMKRLSNSNKVLARKSVDADELAPLLNAFYQQIHDSLPAVQKKSLENQVLPAMETFLQAVEDFRKRYELS